MSRRRTGVRRGADGRGRAQDGKGPLRSTAKAFQDHHDGPNRRREPFYSERDPHGGQYAILTGQLNRLLDNPTVNAYRRTEGLVYRLTGAIPNSWRSEKGGAEMMKQAIGEERAAALAPTLRTE